MAVYIMLPQNQARFDNGNITPEMIVILKALMTYKSIEPILHGILNPGGNMSKINCHNRYIYIIIIYKYIYIIHIHIF